MAKIQKDDSFVYKDLQRHQWEWKLMQPLKKKKPGVLATTE